MIAFRHAIPRPDIALGVLRIETDKFPSAPVSFEQDLAALLERRRAQPLDAGEEETRQACREMLRNGVYRPTGRGKPASEYLLREAAAEAFPRISFPVDANNFISLFSLVPASLWDVDRRPAPLTVFRLGRPGESYVFNPQGQALDLEDLVAGCAAEGDVDAGVPIVTPVKDSLATKLTPESRHVAGVVYFPLRAGGMSDLKRIMARFFALLAASGGKGAWEVLLPEETKTL